MRCPAGQRRRENQGRLQTVRESTVHRRRTELSRETKTDAYNRNEGGVGPDRYVMEPVRLSPIAAPHHFCKHLYRAESSAAPYAQGGPSLVVLSAYGGAQGGEAAGSVLGRAEWKDNSLTRLDRYLVVCNLEAFAIIGLVYFYFSVRPMSVSCRLLHVH